MIPFIDSLILFVAPLNFNIKLFPTAVKYGSPIEKPSSLFVYWNAPNFTTSSLVSNETLLRYILALVEI